MATKNKLYKCYIHGTRNGYLYVTATSASIAKKKASKKIRCKEHK